MYQVIWTDKGVETFQAISDFVLLQWDISKAMEFENRVENMLDKIEVNPFMCQAIEDSPHLRKCVVNKQVSIIYKIDDDKVFLNLFVDNRSDHQYS